MDFYNSAHRKSRMLLKRRKDSFSDKWGYFKVGEHKFMGIISKEEYEALLKEGNDLEKQTEARFLRKLIH